MKLEMKNKLLNFLNRPLISGILKSIPMGIGSLAQNVLSEVGGVGKVDKKELPSQLLKIAIYAVIAAAFLSGKISLDDAANAKDLISN